MSDAFSLDVKILSSSEGPGCTGVMIWQHTDTDQALGSSSLQRSDLPGRLSDMRGGNAINTVLAHSA